LRYDRSTKSDKNKKTQNKQNQAQVEAGTSSYRNDSKSEPERCMIADRASQAEIIRILHARHSTLSFLAFQADIAYGADRNVWTAGHVD